MQSGGSPRQVNFVPNPFGPWGCAESRLIPAMNEHRTVTALTLVLLQLLVGCSPQQPFFVGEDRDLSHALDVAMEIDYPDLENRVLPDAAQANAPYTTEDPHTGEKWELSLQEVLSTALGNYVVTRSLGQVRGFLPVGQSAASPPRQSP